MDYKSKLKSYIVCFLFLIMAYTIYRSKNKISNIIEQDKHTTVCKVFKIHSRRSFTHASYFYYYRGTKYISWESINKSEYEVLNKYYILNISAKHPETSKIDLDKEISDSITIVKAGFFR